MHLFELCTKDMVAAAIRGAEKVRNHGARGATMVSAEEIICMATVLLVLDGIFDRPTDPELRKETGT